MKSEAEIRSMVKKLIDNFNEQDSFERIEIRNFQRDGIDNDSLHEIIRSVTDDSHFEAQQSILVYEPTLSERREEALRRAAEHATYEEFLEYYPEGVEVLNERFSLEIYGPLTEEDVRNAINKNMDKQQ